MLNIIKLKLKNKNNYKTLINTKNEIISHKEYSPAVRN
jgi:hypothetical protein